LFLNPFAFVPITAKVIRDKTYTFCGTPLYIAPEIVLQRGHDHGADHWSWACMLYEMLVGVTPFYRDGMDQMTLFKAICRGSFEFPPGDWMSEDSMDLIDSVLDPDPYLRLGTFDADAVSIREHSWYEDFDFVALQKREMTPPWFPDIKDPLDVSNFDEWGKLEKKEKEGKPPSEQEQLIFKDF
jgi:serine/threonine protein kinase